MESSPDTASCGVIVFSSNSDEASLFHKQADTDKQMTHKDKERGRERRGILFIF